MVPITYRDQEGRLRTTYRTVVLDNTEYQEIPLALVEFKDDKVVSFEQPATAPGNPDQ
jgi:hypothetical protein